MSDIPNIESLMEVPIGSVPLVDLSDELRALIYDYGHELDQSHKIWMQVGTGEDAGQWLYIHAQRPDKKDALLSGDLVLIPKAAIQKAPPTSFKFCFTSTIQVLIRRSRMPKILTQDSENSQ